MRKCLFLILALFASTAIDVAAQEQNNPLLSKVLDRIQQLQNEVTELRNQNELTQYELRTLKKNLDRQLIKLKAQNDTSYTTPTVSLQPAQVAPADMPVKRNIDDLQKIDQKINQINIRLDNLVKTLQAQTPQTPAVETQQPQPVQTEEITPEAETPQPVQTEEITPEVETPRPVQAEETTPEVETPQPVQTEETTPEVETNVAPMEAIRLPDENEYAAYSRAMSALDRADYTRLRDNLSRFLQDYPDGDYTDDANYWVAEAYYAEGNLDLAESYFTQLIEKYGDSEKRESALLKIAYIRLRNEQWEAARNVLELLKNEGEDEQIRKLAIEQLEQLKSRGY